MTKRQKRDERRRAYFKGRIASAPDPRARLDAAVAYLRAEYAGARGDLVDALAARVAGIADRGAGLTT